MWVGGAVSAWSEPSWGGSWEAGLSLQRLLEDPVGSALTGFSVASAAANPALAEADAEPFDGDRGGGAELLPGGADPLGQAKAVGADAVTVAVEVVDALVFGVCLGEDRIGTGNPASASAQWTSAAAETASSALSKLT